MDIARHVAYLFGNRTKSIGSITLNLRAGLLQDLHELRDQINGIFLVEGQLATEPRAGHGGALWSVP